ncbi:MAG: nickel pincer cofactor biosynthesis protein LarB [Sporolactobacillus sp.]|nr:nickel pincer cofactor biosynthesis protein LarB [Sporolactobacillus sp.]
MKFVDIGIAKVDVDRVNRKGFPEVIYGKSKSAKQIKAIIDVLLLKNEAVLVTDVSPKKYFLLKKCFNDLDYNKNAKTLMTGPDNPKLKKGKVLVICGGTSDINIAWESINVLKWMGVNTSYIFDVGVAGLDRLLTYKDKLREADVIIAIAGMEGALPTVVSGLVESPVIAVPTSIGYGANLQGITTMLSMLTSCSSGVTVTNINNGFGAAYQAALIIKRMNVYEENEENNDNEK